MSNDLSNEQINKTSGESIVGISDVTEEEKVDTEANEVAEESEFEKKLKQSGDKDDSDQEKMDSKDEDNEENNEDVNPSDEEVNKDEIEEGIDEGSWYIIQAYTGKEHDVELRINQLIEIKKWQEKIHRVLVPEEEMIEIRNNKRVEKKAKIFAGYVFIQMDDDQEVFYEIRRLPNVAKFVGSKVNPTPVTEDEILKVLRKSGDKTKKIDIDFEVDEVVKVVSGPFRGYSGTITDIYAERGKLKTLIPIFGRETPVELDFDQVEKTVKS